MQLARITEAITDVFSKLKKPNSIVIGSTTTKPNSRLARKAGTKKNNEGNSWLNKSWGNGTDEKTDILIASTTNAVGMAICA